MKRLIWLLLILGACSGLSYPRSERVHDTYGYWAADLRVSLDCCSHDGPNELNRLQFHQCGSISADKGFGSPASERYIRSALTWTIFYDWRDRDPARSYGRPQGDHAVCGNPLFSANKDSAEGVPSSGSIVVEYFPMKRAQMLNNFRSDGVGKYTSTISDEPMVLGDGFSNCTRIDGSQSRCNEDALIGELANFANSNGLPTSYSPGIIVHNYVPLAVSGHGCQVIAVAADNNRSSKEIPASEQKQEAREQPRYMRITARENQNPKETSWGDPETGGSVFNISWRDVDVSYDGKHWFHLMGGFCVKHEPLFGEK
jgi:hypothetical protein